MYGRGPRVAMRGPRPEAHSRVAYSLLLARSTVAAGAGAESRF
jgi:hypothetical protein